MAAPGALIIEDGSSPSTLAAARSLHAAGWRVGIGSASPNPRHAGSRAIDDRHEVPRPELDLASFVAAINAVSDAAAYEVVFPGDDAEMLALSGSRDDLAPLVPYAAHELVLRAIDKLELTRAAEAVGLGVPITQEATPRAIEACALPVMVKSRLHWTPGTSERTRHLLIRRCEDRACVRTRVAEIEAAGGHALLQEAVAGRQVAVSVVVDHDGRVVARSQQTTLAFSGELTSTRAITLPIDEELLERVRALLARLGWFGLANLQLLEGSDGRLRLIDLNGRFYGSLALAVRAGADLPAIWAACAVGSPPPDVATARAGVRFHALEQDLRTRSGARAMLGALAFAPGAAHTLWSLRDPMPAAHRLAAIARGGVRRVRSKLTRSARRSP